MGNVLPEITEDEFLCRLRACEQRSAASPGRSEGTPLRPAELSARYPAYYPALYEHYKELRRWNCRVSLVGPGTASEVVERHYGESLAGLALLRRKDRTLVDVGSGAGFPGLILAAARSAMGPPLHATLIEPKQKKWLFLKGVSRRLGTFSSGTFSSGLSFKCLDARVDRALPAGLPDTVDVVTCRALATSPRLFELFLEHSPETRFLLWYGDGVPQLPRHLRIVRKVLLEGSHNRKILEIRSG